MQKEKREGFSHLLLLSNTYHFRISSETQISSMNIKNVFGVVVITSFVFARFIRPALK